MFWIIWIRAGLISKLLVLMVGLVILPWIIFSFGSTDSLKFLLLRIVWMFADSCGTGGKSGGLSLTSSNSGFSKSTLTTIGGRFCIYCYYCCYRWFLRIIFSGSVVGSIGVPLLWVIQETKKQLKDISTNKKIELYL